MKRTFLSIFILLSLPLLAQNGWEKTWQRQQQEGSYKSSYATAEKAMKNSKGSRERLLAAYRMTLSAEYFQEDVHDSAEARYRRLLPGLDGVDRALCYAFLGSYDTALFDTTLLQRTPVEQVRQFCHEGKTQNMTPTVYDMLVVMMQDRAGLTMRERVDWQNRLCAFHAGDDDEDLRIWHDCRLLEMMDGVPNSRVTLPMVQTYINKYRGTKSPLVTQLYLKAALLCKEVEAVRYCDSAIALFPKSEGGVDCANLRRDITDKVIEVRGDGLTVMPGVASPQRVGYRNLSHLWFRVVPCSNGLRWTHDARTVLMKAKPVSQWDLALKGNDSHRYEEAYFTIPPLEAGRYVLLVSPSANFSQEGCMAYELHCTDMNLLNLGHGTHLLLDRRSGLPIAGQAVRLVRTLGDKESVLATETTADDGRFTIRYQDARWNDRIVVERNGYRLMANYGYNHWVENSDSTLHCQVRVDRPIYRPGDTLHVALLAYHADGYNGMVAPGCRIRVQLHDPNGEPVVNDSLVTDDYGVASATYVLPTDRLPGSYWLRVLGGGHSLAYRIVRVEEYKAPRFMVSLAATGTEAPSFGKEVTVQGMASAYSGVPVGGARVKYRVGRSQMERPTWRHWGYGSESTVAEGELTAAADGSFAVVFTPEPDSNVDFVASTAFRYTVHVDVTDLNGESHEASTSLNVGFRNAFIGLEQDEAHYRELPRVTLHLADLNSRPLAGVMRVRVDRLRRPTRTLIMPDILSSDSSVHHTLDRDEWQQLFPLFAYDAADVHPRGWAVADTVASGEWRVDNGDCIVELPQLISGYYKITATADGAQPLEHYLCLTRRNERRVQGGDILWHDLDKKRANVGDRVTLQFGSAIEGVQAYYMLRIGSRDSVFQRVDCRDDRIHTVHIDVDSSMLGGFMVELYTIREGVVSHWEQNVDVPFAHKELKVEISTFRDKVLPGEQEQWTIRVENGDRGAGTGHRGERSAVVMTMYDDALNSYGEYLEWGFHPWRKNYSAAIGTLGDFAHNQAYWLKVEGRLSYNGAYPSVWTLVDAMPNYRRGRGVIMYKSASARTFEVTTTMEEEELEEVVLADMEVQQELALADMDAGLVFGLEKATENEMGADVLKRVEVRQNLNTLAFFAADVRTDSAGVATYRFTMPELLTRWNVCGMAVTKDLKIGTVDKRLVTAKPLMVQPNMPRFLRQGDSLSLMAKVMLDNAGDVEHRNDTMDVAVTLLLTDAATGDTLCSQSQIVVVSGVKQVMFDIVVPRGVNVATYRITAVAEGMSDGEQGQVPVVSNRQAVTVSQAMYINGVGEKQYMMPEWGNSSSTREPQLVVAEAVSNPVWLAVKSMPFMADHESPSTLYLANQLYVNTLGQSVSGLVDLSPLMADTVVSRLRFHDDIKQTLLQATPWVRAAESEEEQMRAVRNYLDTSAMHAQRERLVRDLEERRNPDGGWSWMPEGRSSLWVTQSVLQKVRGLVGTREALAYVDGEQQRHYDRYIKPYLKKGYKWQPTDVDYLYMRSLYGKASTVAYKFYYDNALKNYKKYENLYTQAQLALIFYRHGDRKAALDLLRRIKEKSLENDEMGLYWRDNVSGWYWYQRPVETQALLIQAFAEITPNDTSAIGLMQQWLLKQKQTTHWGNDRATAEAIAALMVGPGATPRPASPSDSPVLGLSVFGQSVSVPARNAEGYMCQRWSGTALDTLLSIRSPLITLEKHTPGIAWASVSYLFTDDIDKLPASESGIAIRRSYLSSGTLRVGDRLKVRIEITADRAMDYLELIDNRPSCTEPLTTRAGWHWNDGLSYYMVYNNTDTRCYIEHLDKGHYVFEYEVYVTNPGTFLSGPVTMQCMYAPEFRATAPAERVIVE